MAALRGWWLVLLGAFGLFLLVAALGWGAMTYTSQPSFCNNCHLMNTRFVSWQRSPHMAAATCIQCHSEPGRWEELKAHLNGARYLYVMLTGEKSGPFIKAEVSDASCLRCHRRERLPNVVRNHRILHVKHLDARLNCANCHAGLVHGNLYGGQARPAMQLCIDCHAERTPILAACQACHLPPVASAALLRAPR